ncbi:MAG TPA: hypothetical protein VGN07_03245 [Steroidobacteraceae bacterium]|jgi:hypothetical protein
MSTIRADTGGTASRLLRLVLPVHDAPSRIITHHELMDESERRLCSAAHCGQVIEETIASRILDNARTYHRWEDEHAGIMKRIAVENRCGMQKIVLLDASLGLIHRKALFEYLRDRQVRGNARRRLIGLFFSCRDYDTALIAEHGNYLRSAASYLCSSYVGRQLLLDEIFDEPLAQYEQLYSEYFRMYCESVLLSDGDPMAACVRPLVLPLKHQVAEWRSALLALAQSNSGIWRRPVMPEME